MLVLACLLSLGGQTQAQCRFWASNTGAAAGPGPFCANIPGLTDHQRGQITDLQDDFWKDMQKKREVLREKRQALNQLRAEKDVKLKKVNQAIDEVNILEADLAKRQTQYRDDVRRLLNEEQKAFFDGQAPQGAAARGNRPGRGLGPCGRAGGRP
jgi:Spy/CpxP family protein refolding chaperone